MFVDDDNWRSAYLSKKLIKNFMQIMKMRLKERMKLEILLILIECGDIDVSNFLQTHYYTFSR